MFANLYMHICKLMLLVRVGTLKKKIEYLQVKSTSVGSIQLYFK